MSLYAENAQNLKEEKETQKKETFLCFAFCLVLFLPSLNNYINCFFQIGLELELSFVSEASYIAMVLFGGIAALMCFGKNGGIIATAMLIVAAVWLSYFLYPEMRKTIYENPVDLIYNPMNKVMFFCIPALFYTSAITDYKKLLTTMGKFARITVVIGVITYMYVSLYKGKSLQYMVFSYFMLVPICVCVESFKAKHKMLDVVLALLGAISILLCGARGAVLSFLIYLVVRNFFFSRKIKSGADLLWRFIGIIILFFIVFFWENILAWIYNTCKVFEIDSRFVTALIEGTLTESSGRNKIADAILKGMNNYPLGYGLFGDRYVVGTYGFNNFSYAHNFFLEVLCSFGIILGPVFIFVFLSKLLKAIRRIDDSHYNNVLWSLIPYGFFQLFFSSSAIENIAFYMICALIFLKKVSVNGEKDS